MNRPKFLLYPFGLMVLSAGLAWAGQTSLTTYYPSPSGNYSLLYGNNVGVGTYVPYTETTVLPLTPDTVLNVNDAVAGSGPILNLENWSGGTGGQLWPIHNF